VNRSVVYLFYCAWGPTPKRARSRATLRVAFLRPLARAAGAFPFLMGMGFAVDPGQAKNLDEET